MSVLSETNDQFDMVRIVSWYVYVVRIEVGHVLRWALDLEVEGERKWL